MLWLFDWLHDIGKQAANEGIEVLSWNHLLPFAQSRGTKATYKLTQDGERFEYSTYTGDADTSMHASSTPANAVHNLDASHLCLAVVAAYKAGIQVNTIHDSFGIHPNNRAAMKVILNTTFKQLVDSKPLETIHKSCIEMGLDIPPPPTGKTPIDWDGLEHFQFAFD